MAPKTQKINPAASGASRSRNQISKRRVAPLHATKHETSIGCRSVGNRKKPKPASPVASAPPPVVETEEELMLVSPVKEHVVPTEELVVVSLATEYAVPTTAQFPVPVNSQDQKPNLAASSEALPKSEATNEQADQPSGPSITSQLATTSAVPDETGSVATSITISNAAESEKSCWEQLTSVPYDEVKSTTDNLEHGFRFKSQNIGSKGITKYYNCRRIKVLAKHQCNRALMVFISNASNVNCSINVKGKHSCLTASPDKLSKTPVRQDDRQLAKELLGTGVPGRDVKRHLKTKNPLVSKTRLNYIVKQSKKELFGAGTLSLGELEDWAKSKSATPTDEESAFVIGYDIDHKNGRFRMVYSSKRMLSLFRTLNVLSADCTYKTTLQGYPLMVVCLVDRMRHAHPVAFATVTKQEHLDYEFVFGALSDQCVRLGINCSVMAFISDGEIALKLAARAVFGKDLLLINCYFHVMQNVRKHCKTEGVPPETKEQILKDIRNIQVAPTERHFLTACEAFRQKYRHHLGFLEFFNKHIYEDMYKHWYECALPGFPATNNSLEAINRAIKEDHLRRNKEPFGTFKTRIMTVVESYSKPDREVHLARNFTIDDERKAYDWIKLGKRLRTVEADGTYVYVPGGERNEVTRREIDQFTNPRYASFQQYLDEIKTVRRVSVTEGDWVTWNCTCYNFFKKNACFHILVVAVSRGKYQLRPESNTTSLTVKRPAGRPKAMSKALVID